MKLSLGSIETFPVNDSYQEILKLDRMLNEAGIPHTLDRIFDGWQICYPTRYEPGLVMDAVEHDWSYGNACDEIEIMGLLTPDEEKRDTVLGYLTAEEVFKRVKKHHDGDWDKYVDSLSVEDDKEAPWLSDNYREESLMTPEEFAKYNAPKDEIQKYKDEVVELDNREDEIRKELKNVRANIRRYIVKLFDI